MSYGLFVPEVLNEAARTISILRDQAMAKPKTQAPNAIDVHVGSRVRMRRMMLGMSQQTLAKAFGLTFQQVQKYEKGVNRMGSSRLQQAADFLGVTAPFFFEGTPVAAGKHAPETTVPSPDYVIEFVSSSEGLRLIKAFTQIDNSAMRRSIVALVEELAGPK
jgi:transcriptional regulator with XRE-family HTH domain